MVQEMPFPTRPNPACFRSAQYAFPRLAHSRPTVSKCFSILWLTDIALSPPSACWETVRDGRGRRATLDGG